MYLSFGSGEQGHATSCWPSLKGIPTEWRQRVNSPSPSASRALVPMRVIRRMLTAAYAESVSCTPNCDIGEPIGPIQKGTTYIVLPLMHPSNLPFRMTFISAGAIQLLVGPASPFAREQM